MDRVKGTEVANHKRSVSLPLGAFADSSSINDKIPTGYAVNVPDITQDIENDLCGYICP